LEKEYIDTQILVSALPKAALSFPRHLVMDMALIKVSDAPIERDETFTMHCNEEEFRRKSKCFASRSIAMQVTVTQLNF
jgi:hypothetical protein